MRMPVENTSHKCYWNEHEIDWRCFKWKTCEGNENNRNLGSFPFGLSSSLMATALHIKCLTCGTHTYIERHVTNIFIEFKWVDSIPTPANCSSLFIFRFPPAACLLRIWFGLGRCALYRHIFSSFKNWKTFFSFVFWVAWSVFLCFFLLRLYAPDTHTER